VLFTTARLRVIGDITARFESAKARVSSLSKSMLKLQLGGKMVGFVSLDGRRSLSHERISFIARATT
jgi:hypothetical protein